MDRRPHLAIIDRDCLHLLDNAIKYNVESGTISISLTESNSLALFRIANTGMEISKEHEHPSLNDFLGPIPVAMLTSKVQDWD
jgi:signal transduction histidine kinase